MIHLWVQMRHYGTSHGVDPVVFAALYFARLPLLLAALARLSSRVRHRRNIGPAATIFLALGVFPYTYILAFGHDLPAWFITAVAVLAAVGVAQCVRKLRGVLANQPSPVVEPLIAEALCSDR